MTKATDSKKSEKIDYLQEVLDFYDNWSVEKLDTEKRATVTANDLIYDMNNAAWLIEKVQACASYAQNLYAALCNNDFQKLEVVTILKDEKWSCSWRKAGDIVADLRGEGDYIDWYCSGIGNNNRGYGLSDSPGYGYVGEGFITGEIREDLKKIGWAILK